MNTYRSNASGAVSSLGQFSPPPQIAVAVPPSSTQQASRSGGTTALPTVPGANAPGSSNRPPATRGPGGASVPPGPGQGPAVRVPGGGMPITNPSSYQPPSGVPGMRPLPPGQVPGGTPQSNPMAEPVVGPLGGPSGGLDSTDSDQYGRAGRVGAGSGADESHSRGWRQLGRGPASGTGAAVGEDEALGRGVAGVRGAAGTSGMGPMGAGRGRKEEDREHKRADYLQEIEDVWEGGIQQVAPPVIGEE
jgi:hypothetical protein